MSELERELKQYRSCMDHLRAPEALYTEVWNMTIQSESQSDKTREITTETRYTVPVRRHRLLPLVAAFILILAIGMVTYAAKPSLFGWAETLRSGTTAMGQNPFCTPIPSSTRWRSRMGGSGSS